MLDLGLTKMALIGVVALVVLGPKRLPGVARTAGALFGRAQRYIDDVKAEIAREIEVDSVRGMLAGIETAALDVENKVHDVMRQQESELNDAWKSGTSTSDSVACVKDPDLTPAYGDTSSVLTGISNASQTKRRNWRARQAAIPSWYKHARVRKTSLTSGASRTAWGIPGTMRRRAWFF
ncbi:twin arginine-targeting protein translocase TatB [Paraburkholderia ginsengiterrae]|uniref:Sec-independent protein translocase protein TatB n=1 Tax=Paraburkholderia ginsengiterrae TaxID=1462993 RepID=A0A1A9NF81_9BURK|nr:Sec-independent protein translocase protein TatB [Paraburkholderia ginsengiterrae]OAJ63794.1 twin arginine-targeting protein translocase TatB [Paraburkholderia ginsengiterrae]OAJ65157.1 twin arginine-targeting protein translocase TatB [Paraburkholderia ginsengiterrae]